MRGLNLIDNLLQDVHFSIRQLRKNLGFTSTAILMLALGMCASAAIFAFVDAALIKPLPYRNPARLVGVFGAPEGTATYAGIVKLVEMGWIKPHERVVLFNTGTGMKYTHILES